MDEFRSAGPAGLVGRSGGEADVCAPLVPPAGLKAPAYSADRLPPELARLPVEEPDSRRLSA